MDLLSSYFYTVISTITPIRAPFRVLISLLATCLLSPPTLQVGPEPQVPSSFAVSAKEAVSRLQAGLAFRVSLRLRLGV